ncbi:ribosome-binding protein aMBF1 (putative translation factor) [Chryseobacterium rhizosphaerae]|uniref:helix-turn-helix domain-containing protein n=1 Tax=Chryseobacterium rhizosphaerae TaxID=395937 RepID=UPI0028665F7D|nr:helix-turn-helix transcriptional regulator [Chryseobacterium rhizosphaerae]MDR6548473.1 ribosome-binding protein aMBF1 (putative translation factor) [Chryseobacterium rhizosphaerae]
MQKKLNSGAVDQLPQKKRPAGRPRKDEPPKVKQSRISKVTDEKERALRKLKESAELARLLKITGLKPSELAKKVNTRASGVSEFLHGKHEIKVNTLKKWCNILGVDIRILFADDLEEWE